VGTVKSHTGNIYRKLGARNRAEAITRARELGLIR
jgi:DNA-binding CsgD family transcriptional regulator